METIYMTKRDQGGQVIEEPHTGSEIINHAQEVLAQQMGLELSSFAGLEEVEVRWEDGDTIEYVDQAGKPVEFTEDLQLQAAISVLNTNGHRFEATPMR